MKRFLFVLQSVFSLLAFLFLYCTGRIFAEEYTLCQDPLFIAQIVVFSIAWVLSVSISLAMLFIRQKKYGAICSKPIIPSLLFFVPILLPLGGLFGYLEDYSLNS